MNKKRELIVESKKVEGKLIAIGSTEAVDRMGDVVVQDGWDLKNFKKNPVLLFAHQYDQPPVGYAKNIKVVDKQLVFEPVFHDITQVARELKAMYMSDPAIMSAWSVGFIPKEFDPSDFHKIISSELLEISAVPVPANQEALMMACKTLDVGQEKSVHQWFEKMNQEAEKEIEKPEEKKEVEAEKKEEEKKVAVEGDDCEIDGEAGTMQPDKDSGTLVCMPKKKKEVEATAEEKTKSALELATEEIALMAKEGRVLSKKTLALIEDAIGSMSNAVSVLTDLQKSVNAEGDGEDKSAKGRPEEVHKSRKHRIKVRALQKIAKNINEILQQEKQD